MQRTNAAHPMAPCGSCSDEMIMNENVLYSHVGTEERVHQSPPTKETIFLLVRLMDQVYKSVWATNAQQSAFCPLVTNMAKDIPTNMLTNNWSAVGR